MRPVVQLVLVAALCAAVLEGFWHWFGATGLVYAMPVLGLCALPLVEILAGFPGLARRLALRRVAGRYHEFRGRAMDIHVAADARCWVSTADARKIAALPVDAVLSRLAPSECRQTGDPARWRITAEGLAAVLAKSSDPEVTKFCRWLELDVARPARNRRDGRRIPP